MLVEFDGQHHFYPVRFGGMSHTEAEKVFATAKARDKRKTLWAKRNGYHLIRIRYDENIEEVLKESLT